MNMMLGEQAKTFSPALVKKKKKQKNPTGESKAKSWMESSSCTSKKKEMGLKKW